MEKQISVIFLLCWATVSFAQEMKPEDTEVWEPVPPKVIPGSGTAPPSDAIVLFDGSDLSKWEHPDGKDASWKVFDNSFRVVPGTGSIRTRSSFGDIQLHLEWKAPLDTSKSGQQRGNSGVFIMGNYEVQILDNYNNRTYSNGQVGSIYKQGIPMANATKPPGEWQTYDILFFAPVFDSNGKIEKPAIVTVFHNGVAVQHAFEIQGPVEYIGIPEYKVHAPKLPLYLQDHNDEVTFRNIWLRELD